MKKYEAYRDSGIEELGKIPKHWEIKRIKDLVDKVGSGVTPKGGSEVYLDEGIPFLRSQNVYNDGLRIDNVSFISEEVNRRMKNSQIKPQDVLINITGASIGRTCIVPDTMDKANINQHVLYMRIKKKRVGFISYFLKSPFANDWIMSVQAGTSKEALTMGQALNIPLSIPNWKEQSQIANYLDNKTKMIDRKIDLLKQKNVHFKALRKSIINDAVTKGLDKKAKMRDSGVDWIGKIPKDWGVKRFKYFGKTVKGKNLEVFDYQESKSLPLVTLEYLRNDTVEHPSFCYSSNKILRVTENDFIIVWDGAAAGEILEAKEGYISSTIAKVDLDAKKCFPRYFYHLRDSIDYKLKAIPTGMGIPHLNPTLLKNFKCPYPNLKEQTQIANYLDEKTTQIDKIVANITQQINTLTELRKTLINDLVTGKLKPE